MLWMLYARSSCWPPPRYDTPCDSGDSEHFVQMNPANADPSYADHLDQHPNTIAVPLPHLWPTRNLGLDLH